MHSVQSAILFYHFCPSVRLSNAGIESKRMDTSSHIFNISFEFYKPKCRDKIPMELSAGMLNTQGRAFQQTIADVNLTVTPGTKYNIFCKPFPP